MPKYDDVHPPFKHDMTNAFDTNVRFFWSDSKDGTDSNINTVCRERSCSTSKTCLKKETTQAFRMYINQTFTQCHVTVITMDVLVRSKHTKVGKDHSKYIISQK